MSLFPAEDTHGRHKDDFYRTPASCSLALCDELKRRGIEPRTILDVGCGDGAIGAVAKLAWPNSFLGGIDYNLKRITAASNLPNPGRWTVYDWTCFQDFHVYHHSGQPLDLIISNPPFRHALRFLELALARVRPGGHVAFLLPSQWDQETNEDAEGRKRERGRFLDRLRLADGREGYGKLNYEGRVPFRGNGNTDRITYTWYVFGPGFEGVHTRIPRYAPETSEQLSLVK
jgi:SAM-dependent methyltransferase